MQTPMHPRRASRACLPLALLLVIAARLPAQTAPASTAQDKNKDEAVVLSPFEVKTDKDTSYGALNSNSITRFNMELDKTPLVADIFTQEFMNDTAVSTLEDLFNGYANGAGMVLATPESDSTANPKMGDRFSVSQYAQRGLSGGSPKRDGFVASPTQINATDLFDTERVEILHGSQGLIYGAAGAGGTINTVMKQANPKRDRVEVMYRVDNLGSKRGNVDVNKGWGWGGLRFDALKQANNYYGLYTGDNTDGYYGQLAFVLPLHSVLRVSAEGTHNSRINTNNTSVALGNASIDPRNGKNLMYLVLTGQVGATDPATGLPFQGTATDPLTKVPYQLGALDNGSITSRNAKSFAGWVDEETQDNQLEQATLDTTWTKWLSTSIGMLWNKSQEMRATNLGSLSAPRRFNAANPFDDWAISSSMANSENPQRLREYRASVLLTNDFMNGNAHSQTSFGFDRIYNDSGGGIGYQYYLADSTGNVPLDITKNNLGRTQIPTLWWTVPNGPIQYPWFKVGAQSIYYDGRSGGTAGTYVRMPTNPRSAAWVTPTNPLGLASLYAASLSSTGSTNGISGGNAGGFANQRRDQGYYAVNYTSWWHDAVNTFVGFRESDTFTRNPNTQVTGTSAWNEKRTGPYPSYNAGADFAIPRISWLRGYVAYSRTFNTTVGSNDPYGNDPKNPTGYTYEGGFKFKTADNRISGSISAYTAFSKNDNYNAGGSFLNIVNPNGLNARNPGNDNTPNQWAQFDKTSRGLELMLTAQPTKTWRMRFSANAQDSKVLTDSAYAMYYNDQFFADSKGNVTYANGQPFLVPIDPTTLAKVAKQTSVIDPSTYAGAVFVPLTIGMINDYAKALPGAGAYVAFADVNNEPLNGSIGGSQGGGGVNAALKNALANFRNGGTTGVSALTGRTGLPISAMQYAWTDPANYQGTYYAQRKGDKSVGSPAIKMNFTNTYDFTNRTLRGLSIGGSVALAWFNQSFYYTRPTDRVRHLFAAPLNNPQVNTWASYTIKARRFTFKTQLNINNMFNRYSLTINPNNGLGFTSSTNVTATYYGAPRSYLWTNTVSF
jgi:outer membrane receptor for ferric coprogen and ferric-rhodotorulic acid